MSKVVDVLATMANDASLVNAQQLKALLANADLSTEQLKAILAKDSQALADTISKFSISMCSIVSAPEEDEQESQEESKNEEAKNTLKFVANI